MPGLGFGSVPTPTHQPPRDCPVCGEVLTVTRLGCRQCGTELSGSFDGCRYCGLAAADRELLEVFLASRGNLRRIEKHLGVSYPTARQRFADLLRKLGIEDRGEEAADVAEPAEEGAGPGDAAGTEGSDRPGRDRQAAERDRVLSRLASGELSVDEAERILRGDR